MVSETVRGKYLVTDSGGRVVSETVRGKYLVTDSGGRVVSETVSGKYLVTDSGGRVVSETVRGKYLVTDSGGRVVLPQNYSTDMQAMQKLIMSYAHTAVSAESAVIFCLMVCSRTPLKSEDGRNERSPQSVKNRLFSC